MISGEEEARLTLLGVTEVLPERRGHFLLLDIGPGSTEFVLSREGRASTAVSVKLGVVELAERFMDQVPVDHTRYEAMAALPCLEPGRADLTIPSSAICLAALRRLGFDALVVSDRDLREGILYEILAGR